MYVFGMVHMQRSEQYTIAALSSFFEHTPLSPTDRVILFDNDKTSPPQWSKQFPQLEIIPNTRPQSFAANVNSALEIANTHQADLFFLNNDLVFTEDWIEPLKEDCHAILSPVSNGEVQYHSDICSLEKSIHLEEYLEKEAWFELLIKCHKTNEDSYIERMVLPFFCVKQPTRYIAPLVDWTNPMV